MMPAVSKARDPTAEFTGYRGRASLRSACAREIDPPMRAPQRGPGRGRRPRNHDCGIGLEGHRRGQRPSRAAIAQCRDPAGSVSAAHAQRGPDLVGERRALERAGRLKPAQGTHIVCGQGPFRLQACIGFRRATCHLDRASRRPRQLRPFGKAQPGRPNQEQGPLFGVHRPDQRHPAMRRNGGHDAVEFAGAKILQPATPFGGAGCPGVRAKQHNPWRGGHLRKRGYEKRRRSPWSKEADAQPPGCPGCNGTRAQQSARAHQKSAP